MDRKKKKLVYKIATGANQGSTLQADLVVALKAKPKAKSRLERLGINSDEARLINDTRHHSTMLCGTLQRFTSGAAQIIISVDDDNAVEWPVEQFLPPPSMKAKRREFIDGLLFFGIWKNHVILMQSSACRANQFEDYLNWLFNPPVDAAAQSEGDSPPPQEPKEPLMLNDLVPVKVRNEPYVNVERISLLSGLESKVMRQAAPVGKNVSTDKFTPTKEVWNAICGIFKKAGAAVIDTIPLDEALNNDDIKVRLELFCSKKAALTAGPVMNQLANSLRNVDEDIYEVRLSNGLTLKGEQLKVAKEWPMDCANNVPVMHQLHEAMFDYLKELINTGVVIG